MSPTLRCAWVFAAGLPLALLPALLAPGYWVPWAAFLATTFGVMAFDAAMLPRKNAVRSTLLTPAQLAVGEPGKLHLRVRSPRMTRPLSLCAHLDLDGPTTPFVEERGTLEVDGKPSGGEVELVFGLSATRRGRIVVRTVWLRVESPLGFFRRTISRPASASVPVTLSLGAVSKEALRFLDQKVGFGGVKAVRFIGDGTEFESLREYAPGLDPRSIDWRASARHRRLLSRDFRAERNHPVVVAVDTGRLMSEPIDGLPRLDRATNAALALALVAIKTGDRAGFYSFDDRPRLYSEPRSGMESLRRIQHLSVDLAYSSAETNFTLGLLSLYQRLRRRSLVVLFTDFVDHATTELLIENTTRLARRHLVVFVTIRDPLLSQVRDRAPESPGDVHRAVVAGELISEREQVLRRLRRLGVICVDAPWRSLCVDLLNQYVDVKRRELVG